MPATDSVAIVMADLRSELRFEHEVEGGLGRSTEAREARLVDDTAEARFAGLRTQSWTAL